MITDYLAVVDFLIVTGRTIFLLEIFTFQRLMNRAVFEKCNITDRTVWIYLFITIIADRSVFVPNIVPMRFNIADVERGAIYAHDTLSFIIHCLIKYSNKIQTRSEKVLRALLEKRKRKRKIPCICVSRIHANQRSITYASPNSTHLYSLPRCRM